MLFRWLRDGDDISTGLNYDAEKDEMSVRRTQDVEPILDDNKRILNASDGYSPSRELRFVRRIPGIVVEQWMKQGINPLKDEDWPMVARLLDLPEFSKFRTADCKLGRRAPRTYIGAGGSRKSEAEKIQDLESGVGKGV